MRSLRQVRPCSAQWHVLYKHVNVTALFKYSTSIKSFLRKRPLFLDKFTETGGLGQTTVS